MENKPSATSSGVAIDENHGVLPGVEVKSPLAGLTEQEKEIIQRQTTAPTLTVGYFSLFRYASRKDTFIMVLALIASIAAGAVMPLMTVSGFVHTSYLMADQYLATAWRSCYML